MYGHLFISCGSVVKVAHFVWARFRFVWLKCINVPFRIVTLFYMVQFSCKSVPFCMVTFSYRVAQL